MKPVSIHYTDAGKDYKIVVDPREVGCVFFDKDLAKNKWKECVGPHKPEKPPKGIEGPFEESQSLSDSPDPPPPGPGACYEVGGQIYCW